MSDILHDKDPAMRRYQRLLHALGGDTALSAFEEAGLARVVAWSSESDINILIRLIHRRSRDTFDVGRLAGRAEVEEGTE